MESGVLGEQSRGAEKRARAREGNFEKIFGKKGNLLLVNNWSRLGYGGWRAFRRRGLGLGPEDPNPTWF